MSEGIQSVSLNPVTKEGLKNVTSVGICADLILYLLIFFYPRLLSDLPTYLSAVASVGILLVIRVLLFAADPLETLQGSWPPEPAFFRSQYPSIFLVERCDRCTARSKCGNRPLTRDSRLSVAIWYEWFESLGKDDRLVQRTYEKGFTCRFIFYMKYCFLFFAVLGGITEISLFMSELLGSLNHGLASPVGRWSWLEIKLIHDALHFAFIGINLCLWGLVSWLNRADNANPTGCWSMWRDINTQHVMKLIRAENRLVNLVCNRYGEPQSVEAASDDIWE
jgi:hypothetical protein